MNDQSVQFARDRSPVNADAVGAWIEVTPIEITGERLAAYAAVIGDDEPSHARRASAPPVFPALIVHPSVNAAVAQVIGSKHASNCLHGEHGLLVQLPLYAGQEIGGRVAVTSVRATRAGTVLLTRAEVIDCDQRVLSTQYFTSLLPGEQLVDVALGASEEVFPTPPPRPADGVSEATCWIPDDVTYRYADVSGDHHRYHTDPAAARAAGYDGVIAHGLCSLAIAIRMLTATLCPLEPDRVTAVHARFSAVLLPGQRITTRLWPGPTPGRWGFELADEGGRVVLKNGLVTARPALRSA